MTELEMQAYLENLNQQIYTIAAGFPAEDEARILKAYQYASVLPDGRPFPAQRK